jgi:hypothetical protein
MKFDNTLFFHIFLQIPQASLASLHAFIVDYVPRFLIMLITEWKDKDHRSFMLACEQTDKYSITVVICVVISALLYNTSKKNSLYIQVSAHVLSAGIEFAKGSLQQ